MRTDDLYIVDILDAGDAIAAFLQGVDLPTFLRDDEKRSAILWQLTVIGEACTRLSDETRSLLVMTPWNQIRRFRNLLVHGYFVLKWEEVWRIATQEVPPLCQQIDQLLTERFPDTHRQRLVRGANPSEPER